MPAQDAPTYADQVKDLHLRRKLSEVATEAADGAYARSVAEENRRRLTAQQTGQQRAGLAAQGTDLEGSPTDNEDLFDPENIDRYIGEESNRRRGRARDLEGTGNSFLNFLAAAGLETATPHGLAGLFVPVSRLPSAAATATARSFLGNVLREGAQAASGAVGRAGPAGLGHAAEGMGPRRVRRFRAHAEAGAEGTGDRVLLAAR